LKDLDLHPNISWHPLQYHKSPPVLSSLYDITRLRLKAKRLVEENKIKVVHCRGYITSLVGLDLKIGFGLKFIFDMRGFWADEKLESGNWSSPIFKPVYRYFKKKEKQFIINSDRVISLTNAGKTFILDTFSVDAGKVRVVPTCVDLSHFQRSDSSERNLIRKHFGIEENESVFIYSGSLGGNYPVKLLMEYYEELSKDLKKSRLLVLSRQNDLLNGYPEVISKSVDRNKMPQYLSAGNTGIIFYKSGFSNIGRCPTKYAEYVACGLNVEYPEPYGDLGAYDPTNITKFFDLAVGVNVYDEVYKDVLNPKFLKLK